MRTIYSFCFVLLSLLSNAQFSKSYSPSKWTTFLTAGSSGSVNTSGAPASITITGSDSPTPSSSPMDIDYTITALATGVFSFNWSYHSNDGDSDPQYDPAGIVINGTFTQLTSNTFGEVDQSSTYSVPVTAGSIIGFRVRATDNYFGNATFTISSFSPPGGVLPIILESFTGQKNNRTIQLEWSSSTQINFSHFIVERSTDGIGFTPLQTISANTIHRYTFADEHPFSGRNFYRLKLVDNDGSLSYSKTIAVDMGSLVELPFVWPNPAADQITVRINAAANSVETLGVINSTGALVLKRQLTLRGGINDNEINLASFANGVYYIQLETSGVTLKFTKQ